MLISLRVIFTSSKEELGCQSKWRLQNFIHNLSVFTFGSMSQQKCMNIVIHCRQELISDTD